MLAEANEAQRFLGAKFGTDTSRVKPGIYAVPTNTSKGKAFMKLVIGETRGMSGFELFWDEDLTISWYSEPKPDEIKESKFSKLFRQLEKIRD